MDRRKLIKSLAVLVVVPSLAKASEAKSSPLLLQHSSVAGFQYYQGEELWPELKSSQVLILQREADNPYDKRAVAIYRHEANIGYIPRRDNAAISQLLDRAERLQAVIEAMDESAWKRMMVAVSVG